MEKNIGKEYRNAYERELVLKDNCDKVEPDKPTFKKGDWVLITKPKDVRKKPTWYTEMDEYDGKTLMIGGINKGINGTCIGIGDWNFHPDWCTKVEAPKPNEPKVGDRCILWGDEKSNAMIGIVTKINYESDCPYEVADIIGYKNCIKFESMEQYNKFIKE